MDFDDPFQRRIFFEIHDDLPRQAPGNFDCAQRALELAGPLPERPRVLDIGCGPGMQTMHLAQLLPGAIIRAVEAYEPFVEEVRKRAEEAGVADRVVGQVGDMTALDVRPGSIDLIWCEGAAYIMGVERALRNWRDLLKPGGKLAVTEAVWLREDAPIPVRRCWEEYPGMRDVAAQYALVDACGYKLLGDFVLPPEAWWDDYYTPLEERVAAMEEKYKDDAAAMAVIKESREEIEVYREYSDFYGYIFLIMEKAD